MNAKEWARLIRGMNCIGPDQWLPSEADARLLAQRVTGTLFLSHAPSEHFSTLTPVRSRQVNPDELRIDTLYGSYDPSKRVIEIYIEQLARDQPQFDRPLDHLVKIVRLHEYAHALVHLGISSVHAHNRLRELDASGRTQWIDFIRQRNRRFRAIPEDAGELLAQSIAWAALGEDPSLQLSFQELEKKQPAEYRLSDEIKAAARAANWPLVITAARGEISKLPSRASRRDALAALIQAPA